MNIYTYVDSLGFLREISETQLNFAGNWLSTITYNVNDVVIHNLARYICTGSNAGQEPPKTLQFDAFWSVLAFTSTGTGSSNSGTNSGSGASVQMVEDVYSLAYRAYTVALTGTDLPVPGAGSVPAWFTQWVGHTYNIAVAGTTAAHSSDRWGRDAFGLAVTGTNSANQAYSLALHALETAWAGTNSSNFPAWVMPWIGQTYNLARSGTNAAAAVDTTARIALNTAWAGTDAAHEADSWGRDAFGLAVAGTNAAHSAWDYAGEAWAIAVAGTDAANAASSLAHTALDTAWTGTNTLAAVVLCAAFTPVLVGPDVGEIPVPYSYDGSTSLAWTVRRLDFRVQTAGTGSTAIIEKSTTTGPFSSTSVGTVSVDDNVYYGSNVVGLGTVNSGDSLRFNVRSLGTTQNWTLITQLSYP